MTVLLQPQPLVLCTHSHTSHLTPVFSIISPPIDDIIACAGFAVLFVHFQIKIFYNFKGCRAACPTHSFLPDNRQDSNVSYLACEITSSLLTEALIIKDISAIVISPSALTSAATAEASPSVEWLFMLLSIANASNASIAPPPLISPK